MTKRRPNRFMQALTDAPWAVGACVGLAFWGALTFLAYLPWAK
jgi:hypothetical protein